MSSNINDAGGILEHLIIPISSEKLENAFRFGLVSNGCFGGVYRVPHDGVQCAAKYQDYDDYEYKEQFKQEYQFIATANNGSFTVQVIGTFSKF